MSNVSCQTITHFDSVIDYFIAIKNGDIPNPKCIGYGAHSHPLEPTELNITVTPSFYSHLCPICGFGSGGGISMDDYNKWMDYNTSHTSKTEEKENGE